MIDSINPNEPKIKYKQYQEEEQKKILDNDTFFPKGVHLDDIDRVVRDTIFKDFKITSPLLDNDEPIPIYFFGSLNSYTQSIQTWQNVDTKKSLNPPFMALVRESIVEKGSNLGGNYNIPSNPTYTLWKRPIVKNGKKSYEHYQIPQPVNVDVKYSLHFFTTLRRDLNTMDELILYKFKSSQYYMNIWGHYMPLKLETSVEEHEKSDLDKKKYYHQSYSMLLKGYLLNEKEFVKLSSIDLIAVDTDSCIAKQSKECIVETIDLDCDTCFSFKFNRKSNPSKTIKIPKDLNLYYDNMSSSNNHKYFVNNEPVQMPFDVKLGDQLTVAHNFNYNGTIEIRICGKTI